MPANPSYDFVLGGNGYMLARDPKSRGRAWVRTGNSDALATEPRVHRSETTGDEYGSMPDELDHAEVQDDWSGGFGQQFMTTGMGNHYATAVNMDTRFQHQAFPAQQVRYLGQAAFGSVNINADYFVDVPLPGVANPPGGAGAVLAVGRGYIASFTPTDKPYTQASLSFGFAFGTAAFDFKYEATGGGALGFGGRPAVFGSYTYIPNANGSGFYQRGHDGTTYTVSSLSARWFTVAAGRMWRGHTRNLVQSCAIGADPMVAANWSATLALGNGFLTTRDAISFQDRVFVGFPDGVYMGDQTGTFQNIASTLAGQTNIDNCRDLTVHNDMVVFAQGPEVWGYSPANSSLRQLMPRISMEPFGSANNSALIGDMPFKFSVTALNGWGRWLYAGAFDGSFSYLLCGLDASAPLPYVWHAMQCDGPQLGLHQAKLSRIHVDSLTSSSGGAPVPQRIWIANEATYGALSTATSSTYLWPIPAGDFPPMADLTFSPCFAPSALLQHSVRDWESPSSPKVWRKIETMADLIGATVASGAQAPKLSFQSVIDATMNAFFIGGNVQASLSGVPKDVTYFTNAFSTAVGLRSQSLLRWTTDFQGTHNYNSAHRLRSVVERGSLRPRSNDVITAQVQIADGLRDRQGNEMRPGATQIAELRALGKGANPAVLVDLIGATLPVVVFPTIEEREVYQGGSDNPEIVATVKIGVLDASWGI